MFPYFYSDIQCKLFPVIDKTPSRLLNVHAMRYDLNVQDVMMAKADRCLIPVLLFLVFLLVLVMLCSWILESLCSNRYDDEQTSDGCELVGRYQKPFWPPKNFMH